jgi:dTDP-4-dehydrorhamnose 3,5-epimerase
VIFHQFDLPGAWLLEPERHEDDRGAFTRLYCQRELSAHGLSPVMAQSSLSSNHAAGTVRGLHFQAAPFQEGKLVRVVRGAIFDVVVDLRQHSPTYGRHVTAELSADNGRSLWVPPGCAHGFQTLEDDTDVLYFISEFYRPEAGRGVRYDDPELGIPWPLPVSLISEQDLALPTLRETAG